MERRDPVIRLVGRRGVLALYESHLVIAKLRGELTEGCFDSDGQELAKRVVKALRIDYSHITRIRETMPSKHRFEVRTAARTLSFKVSAGETVREVLGAACPDRYRVCRLGKARLSKVITLPLGVIAGMVLMGGIAVFLATIEFGVGGGGFAETWPTWAGIAGSILGPMGFFAYVLFFSRPVMWLPLAALPAAAVAKSTVRGARTRAGTMPLYSPVLGWALKLAGAVYWVFVWGPWSTVLNRWAEALVGAGSMNQGYFWLVAWAPAPLLIYGGHRLSLKGYDPKAPAAGTEDPGAVVFLRPFEEDMATTLQPKGILAELTGVRARGLYGGKTSRLTQWDYLSVVHPIQVLRMLLGKTVTTSEETLARFFQRFGRVVAIGKPGERLAVSGAQRMYVGDTEWQGRVIDELARARAVIMQPGTTEGVAWEMEQVRQRVDPTRVLLCLISFQGNPMAYEGLSALAERAMGVRLPRIVPFLKVPAFVYFDLSWNACVQPMSYRSPVVWPLVGDACDLEWTLRPFVEGVKSQEHRAPAPVRGRSVLRRAAAAGVGIVVALAVLILPMVAVQEAKDLIWKAPRPSPVNALMAGEWRTLRGKEVPYSLQVPAALEAQGVAGAVTYHGLSPDHRMEVVIVASNDVEDLSGLAEAVRAGAANALSGVASVQVDREVTDGSGNRWREVEVTVRAAHSVFINRLRATSGPRATVVVKVQERQDVGAVTDYAAVTKRVLDSLTLGR